MYLDFVMNKDPDAIIELPMPPSVNQAYSNAPGVGRVKSRQYKQWRLQSKTSLIGKKLPVFETTVGIKYDMFVPDNRIRDCANYEKLATDFLVSMGIIKDDYLVRLNIQQWMDWEPKAKKIIANIYSLSGCV